jgi:phospholipase A-2-activating protein
MDNVVQFIEQNTKGATLGEASGGGPDPYGTEARYRPGDGLPDSKKTIPQTEYLSIRNAKYEGVTALMLP